MLSYFFWDIENVSIHNLEKIMDRVRAIEGEVRLFAVYSKIKESRKTQLVENGWILTPSGEISKNSADHKIKNMIESILGDQGITTGNIFLITEDKGFYKISQKIIQKGINLEIITGTKNPDWIKDLKKF